MSRDEAAEAAIDAIALLSKSVGIPAGLTVLGVKAEDHKIMAEHARKDVCMLTNPRKATLAEIVGVFESAM